MMVAIYILAYLVVGAIAVRIADRLMGEKLDANLASLMLILWPCAVLVYAIAMGTKVFIPDIFERPSYHFPPPPPPPNPPDIRKSKAQ